MSPNVIILRMEDIENEKQEKYLDIAEESLKIIESEDKNYTHHY